MYFLSQTFELQGYCSCYENGNENMSLPLVCVGNNLCTMSSFHNTANHINVCPTELSADML